MGHSEVKNWVQLGTEWGTEWGTVRYIVEYVVGYREVYSGVRSAVESLVWVHVGQKGVPGYWINKEAKVDLFICPD